MHHTGGLGFETGAIVDRWERGIVSAAFNAWAGRLGLRSFADASRDPQYSIQAAGSGPEMEDGWALKRLRPRSSGRPRGRRRS